MEKKVEIFELKDVLYFAPPLRGFPNVSFVTKIALPRRPDMYHKSFECSKDKKKWIYIHESLWEDYNKKNNIFMLGDEWIKKLLNL
jgi:hypothetical protein